MKVLVTGAAGFLGSHFTRFHLERGDQVVAVDDLSNAKEPPFAHIKVDAGEYCAQGGSDFDLAFHFAAPVGGRVKIEGDPLYNAGSLRLDAAFFSWAIQHAGVAVYPSSSAVYGVALQEQPGQLLAESDFHPDTKVWMRPDEMYGFTKMAGEVLAYKAQSYGLSTLCIRPFSGYGEGQSFEYPVPSICRRALAKQDPLVVWGSGSQARDFIHVNDVVAATELALQGIHKGYQALNLGSGVGTTFREIAEIAADLAGYHPQIVVDTSKPEGVMHRVADISRMKTIYQPTIPLKDGLRRVLEYIDAESDQD